MMNSKARANTNIAKILEFYLHKSELSDIQYPSSVIHNINTKLHDISGKVRNIYYMKQ